MVTLESDAEKHALDATTLESFPVNLPEVKRAVANILSTFGRSLIFAEYTVHDISHVDDILETLKWLIPKETQQTLSAADWLMIVLSAYFHDMGLVVTEDEFSKRDQSGFKVFCDERLFVGPGAADYKAKVQTLAPEKRERFLYEEFVRANHGQRVRSWIEGTVDSSLGISQALTAEISRLLGELDRDFRRDLGVVCESHNLDDLDDFKKYKVSRPYGNSDAETANLHYCALILRTVDLVQITKRRVPAALFRTISPSDPISQIEWSKQAAVKRVKAKPKLDQDGAVSAELQSDTIEVVASFTDDNGFFGLSSYLQYARGQLAESFALHQEARKLTTFDYRFPWRFVDDSSIEVEGFEKEPYGFEIDQEKVLDLLTGHTLYNDSSIVIRELVQNSIDAIRYQSFSDNTNSDEVGSIRVQWNSANSELTVLDNGTGMTKEVIERHFLKVGSSRYQDSKFKEANPQFSPISRFGIGVLSCFMVADAVDIVTVSPDDDSGRRILLRSVHGKYLIRLLDKRNDPLLEKLGPHGTCIKITFRASAKRIDVLETVRKWILFPRCHVTVAIDGEPEVEVGYTSPKAALEQYFQSKPSRYGPAEELKIEQREKNGLTLAYAMVYSSHFKDWSFVGARQGTRVEREAGRAPVATCIEGIAVEFEVPGFRGLDIVALGNATGGTAPRTNVARSALEVTPEYERLAEATYQILFDGVAEEVQRLQTAESYSLTWSIQQLPYIASPLFLYRGHALFPEAHDNVLEKLPAYLLESDGRRTQQSLSSLRNIGEFWTADSQLMRSVESFVREAKAEVTAEKLIEVSQGTATSLPQGAILSNLHSGGVLRSEFDTRFQVRHLQGHVNERRLDLKWAPGNDLWLTRADLAKLLIAFRTRDSRQAYEHLLERASPIRAEIAIPKAGITSTGLDEYSSVLAYGKIMFLPSDPLLELFGEPRGDESTPAEIVRDLVYMTALVVTADWPDSEVPSVVDRFFNQTRDAIPREWVPDRDALKATALATANRMYDPLAWNERRQSE